MARQRTLDPELARLAADRLARVLSGDPPRRAVERLTDGAPARAAPEPPPSAGVEHGREELSGELETLPPARRFSGWHVRVVVLLLLVGIGCAGWALLRARPVAVASPGTTVALDTPAPTVPAPAPSGTGDPSGAGSASTTLVVHVLGAVRHPGLVTLPDRSRVQDALDAAGGLTRNADPGELNLAQLVSDGEQIVVGTRGHPAGEVRDGGGPDPSGDDSSGAGSTLDLNRATETQLEQLPGVGPVTAGKILAWRQEHRRFTQVTELQEVDGIGPKTYAQIAPHVRV